MFEANLSMTASHLWSRQATEKNEGAAMVLYFTGTGNSRYLARRIAEGWVDVCKEPEGE